MVHVRGRQSLALYPGERRRGYFKEHEQCSWVLMDLASPCDGLWQFPKQSSKSCWTLDLVHLEK